MDKHELEQRTSAFAVQSIRFINQLPKCSTTTVITYQLIKCTTSIGANYREANRAQSRADFIHKISIAEKECSESCYWLEIIQQLELEPKSIAIDLLKEARELLAIFTAIGHSAKTNRPRKRND